jgi:ABC-2 type transport system permease protein
MFRVGFFPDQWNTLAVVMAIVEPLVILGLGILVFRRLERPVLKEL